MREDHFKKKHRKTPGMSSNGVAKCVCELLMNKICVMIVSVNIKKGKNL